MTSAAVTFFLLKVQPRLVNCSPVPASVQCAPPVAPKHATLLVHLSNTSHPATVGNNV